MFFTSLKLLFLHNFKSKKSILKLLSIIFVPLIYGFIYIAAFWNPFNNLDKLPFAIVYNTHNKSSSTFVDLMKLSLKEEYRSDTNPKFDNFKISIDYVDDKKPSQYNYQKNMNKYPFAITIGNKFADNLTDYLIHYLPDRLKPKLNFYSSYKYNFIVGELGQFFAINLNNIINKELAMFFLKIALFIIHDKPLNVLKNFSRAFSNLVTPKVFNKYKNDINKISIDQSLNQNQKNLKSLENKINNTALNWWKDPGINLDIHNQGQNDGINIYGYGLAPFFICIAIWIGAVLHISIYKRNHFKNPNKKEKLLEIFKNSTSKLLFINCISILQWLILLLSLSILGLHFHYFGLFLFYSIISVVIFNFIIFVIFELFYSDLARFISLVILILQLASSGGTFPIVTQSLIFQFFNKFNIFSYFINGVREFYINPSFTEIFVNLGYIFLFFVIFLAILIIYKVIHYLIHNQRLKNKLKLLAIESVNAR